jgi:hypothetical protein
LTTFEYFEEQLFLATVMLLVREGEKASLGTGFMVLWPVRDKPGVGIIAIVTCRHVLREGKGTVSCKMHRVRESDPRSPDLDNPVTVAPSAYGNIYFSHDDPTVDVAAINVSEFFGRHKELYQNSFDPMIS